MVGHVPQTDEPTLGQLLAGSTRQEKRELMGTPRTFATYGGKCPGCGEQIVEGDPIFLVEEEWVCESCYGEDE